MCGLFGGSGRLNPQVLTSLGCQNEKRGTDSSGIAWHDKEEGPVVEKVAQHPLVSFPKILSEAIERASVSGVCVGHTRASTTGAVTAENAHPFLMDGVAFAHNGIIGNYKDFGTYEVDSQALIHGIKKKNFSAYHGPVALVWIDGGLLHCFRNGNPLYRGTYEGGTYLASERTFLGRVGCKKIKEVTEGRIYTFKHGEIVRAVPVARNKVEYWSTSFEAVHQSDWKAYSSAGYYGRRGRRQWWASAPVETEKEPIVSEMEGFEDDLRWSDYLRKNGLLKVGL